jgi:hypothetical protein
MGSIDDLHRFIFKETGIPPRRTPSLGPVPRDTSPPRKTGIDTDDPYGAKEAYKIHRQAKRKAERDAKAQKVHQDVMQEVKRNVTPTSDEVPM